MELFKIFSLSKLKAPLICISFFPWQSAAAAEKWKCQTPLKNIVSTSTLYQAIDKNVAQWDRKNSGRSLVSEKVSPLLHLWQLQTCKRGNSSAMAFDLNFLIHMQRQDIWKSRHCLLKLKQKKTNWEFFQIKCKDEAVRKSELKKAYVKPKNTSKLETRAESNNHGVSEEELLDPNYLRKDPEFGSIDEDSRENSGENKERPDPTRPTEPDNRRHGEEQPNNPSIPSEEDASWHDRTHT